MAFITAAALAAAAPALAQPAKPAPKAAAPAAAGRVPDVRCLMDMLILSQQPQAQQKQTGQAGVLFFAGRISKAGGAEELSAAMKAQLPSLQQQQVQAELPKCGAVFQQTMQSVQTAFNSLRPPGAPAPGAAAPAAPAAPAPAAPAAPPPK